jgi:hypothetical protein
MLVKFVYYDVQQKKDLMSSIREADVQLKKDMMSSIREAVDEAVGKAVDKAVDRVVDKAVGRIQQDISLKMGKAKDGDGAKQAVDLA